MQEELTQFKHNDVWELVPRPKDKTVVGTRCVFKNKLEENNLINRNKARLVEKVYTHAEGINYEETYALVAHGEVIRLLLAFSYYLDFN